MSEKEDLEQQFISEQDKELKPPDCDLAFVFKIDEKYKEEKMNQAECVMIDGEVFKTGVAKMAFGKMLGRSARVEKTRYEAYDDYREKLSNILKNKCGLDVTLHSTTEHHFLKVQAKEELLEQEAHRISYKLRFKNGVDVVPKAFDPSEKGMAYDCPPYAKVDTRFYIDKDKKQLFQQYENGSRFRQVDRIRLINSIVSRFVIVPQAEKRDLFTQFVPQHVDAQEKLAKVWINCNPCKGQPLEGIRNYYGEQVALYFCWVDHLYKWLVFPAILGIIATILLYYWQSLPISTIRQIEVGMTPEEVQTIKDEKRYSSITALIFSTIVIIWSICFLEFWKRKQAQQALEWGMDDFEEEERPRPEFKGTLQRSKIDGKWEKTFPKGTRKCRQVVGLTMAVLFVVITISIVGAILFYRQFYSKAPELTDEEHKKVPMAAAFINAIQIKIMNFVYEKIAVCMNDWENYRTKTEYEDNLYGKIFAFQFVNSFVSLYYMAFIKEHVEGCKMGGSCTSELALQLFILFITFIGMNGVEIGIPFIAKWRSERQQKKDGLTLDQLETEADMSGTEVQGDYQELMICFGYLTLFAASLPVAPLLALIAVSIEVKVDAYKFVRLVQRPFPDGAADVGIWQSILHFMAIAAVITNIALIMLTDNKFEFDDTVSGKQTQWAVFVIIEHVVLLLIFIIEEAVPDEADETADMKKRHQYLITEKYYDIDEDEDAGDAPEEEIK